MLKMQAFLVILSFRAPLTSTAIIEPMLSSCCFQATKANKFFLCGFYDAHQYRAQDTCDTGPVNETNFSNTSTCIETCGILQFKRNGPISDVKQIARG